MIRAGILSEHDRVELIEGRLVEKMPNHPAHTFSVERSRETLEHDLLEGFFINVQQPITTSTSEPEPDVTVIRGDREDFATRHPSPEDVALLIEVSDSTLKYDRTTKQRLYAVAGVLVYWIVNVPEKQLEVYTSPSADTGSYEAKQIYALADTVTFLLDAREIMFPVKVLFPKT
jgi:Uma2 family endonuclease